MKKSLLSALFIFAVSISCAAQARKDGAASLLVSYLENDRSDVQHVERLDFVGGELVSRKKVASFSAESDDDGTPGAALVGNRYLVNYKPRKIFDLRVGRFVDGFPSPPRPGENPKLPGLVSPDGTKSVDPGGQFVERTDRLEIHFAGGPPVVVRDGFKATVRSISSFRPRLPLLWIDNDTILPQRSNGNLVTVTTDGSVKPFLQLLCTPDDGIHLDRNRSGKLVYYCGGENYFLEVKNGAYERIKDDLGNGFEHNIVGRDSVYYYKGEEIGREGLDAATTKSYLAMLYGGAKDGVIDSAGIKTVKVWNAAKRGWTTYTFDGWSADIVGWIE